MRSVQGKRYGFIWNGWSDGQTTFRNESMSGLTFRAMQKAAANDPKIAAGSSTFASAARLSFMTTRRIPTRSPIASTIPATASLVTEYRGQLIELMRKSNDPELNG